MWHLAVDLYQNAEVVVKGASGLEKRMWRSWTIVAATVKGKEGWYKEQANWYCLTVIVVKWYMCNLAVEHVEKFWRYHVFTGQALPQPVSLLVHV